MLQKGFGCSGQLLKSHQSTFCRISLEKLHANAGNDCEIHDGSSPHGNMSHKGNTAEQVCERTAASGQFLGFKLAGWEKRAGTGQLENRKLHENE